MIASENVLGVKSLFGVALSWEYDSDLHSCGTRAVCKLMAGKLAGAVSKHSIAEEFYLVVRFAGPSDQSPPVISL